MSIFSKPKNYLGVDIGSSSIKVIELTKNKDNNPQLVTYGYSEESIDIIKGNSKETQAKTAASLKTICEKARVSTKTSIAALPNFFVFSSIINLPPSIKKKDLSSAINWEAKKFVPMPIEEVVLDWKILNPAEKSVDTIISDKGNSQNQKNSLPPSGSDKPASQPAENPKTSLSANPSSSSNSASSNQPPADKNQKPLEPKTESPGQGENLNILLTAAPKNLVKKYVDVCQAAGLQLLSLETESFALSRSLVGCNPYPAMIIDMGALVSDIIIMEKGIPVLSKSIDVGGKTITQSIMNILNVDVNRAEQFKRDFGAPLNVEVSNFSSTPSPTSNLATGGVPRAISTVLDSLMHEIRYSVNLYQNQTKKRVEKVVLSGGSAFLPNFTNYLSNALSLPVYIGNPWERVSYPTELKPVLASLAPRFAVAVGLAMREII